MFDMDDAMNSPGCWAFVVLLVLVLAGVGIWGFPQYRVWAQEMRGQADLAEAKWNRQIRVEEAQAELEAAKLDAQAEIERAYGLAEANQIIGESLKENYEYLVYLWIQGLNDSTGEIIYVPTEGNLPILEASRFQLAPEPSE